MADESSSPTSLGARLVSRPWLVLTAGLFATGLGWILSGIPVVPLVPRLALIFGGLFVTLIAVVNRLRQTSWDLPQRIESAALISLAGLAALLGYLAMEKDHDSGHMFCAALFLVSLAGALLVLLPPLGRRVVISLIVVFHFAGIGVAITAIDPPNGPAPWLPRQLYTWVYRPYLSFMYLTNAYHFYSPEPGPPSFMWFAVKYDDDSYTWIKLPDPANSPIGMHYQRMLALPEHSYSPLGRLPYSNIEVAGLQREKRLDEHVKNGWYDPDRGPWEEIYMRRELGSTLLYRTPDLPEKKALPIPMVWDIDLIQQYREPTEGSKKLLVSVAMRVLWNAPPRQDGATPRSVKVYRVTHQIVTPAELAAGVSPWEKPKHLPFFMGEFDREGRLMDSKDPFLYWYLPIVRVPKVYPDHGLMFNTRSPVRLDLPTSIAVPAVYARIVTEENGMLLDCLEMHAAGRVSQKPKEKK
jgi:hypothetical protein